MSKAFEDWFIKTYNQYYSRDNSIDIEIRDAFNAGRACQREVDASLVGNHTTPMIGGYNGNTPGRERLAKAIREQKIDD